MAAACIGGCGDAPIDAASSTSTNAEALSVHGGTPSPLQTAPLPTTQLTDLKSVATTFATGATAIVDDLSVVKSAYDLATTLLQVLKITDPNADLLRALAADMQALQGQLDALGLQAADNLIASALNASGGLDTDIADWQRNNPTRPFPIDGNVENNINQALSNVSNMALWRRPRSTAQQAWQFPIGQQADASIAAGTHQSAGLWDAGYQWDWRVGVNALMHAITTRLALITTAYPDWQRYPRGFVEELSGYADLLDQVTRMMDNGIRCGTRTVDQEGLGTKFRYFALACVDLSSEQNFQSADWHRADDDDLNGQLALPTPNTPWVVQQLATWRTQLRAQMGTAQIQAFSRALRFAHPVQPPTSGGAVVAFNGGMTAYAASRVGGVVTSVDVHQWSNDSVAWSASGTLKNPDVLPNNSPLAVLERVYGHHDLFAIDANGTLMCRYDDDFGGNNDVRQWGPISQVGVFAPGTPVVAVARSIDDMDVFAVAKNGQILDFRWDGRNPTWAPYSGWNDARYPIVVGNAPPGAPLAAVARTPLDLDVAWIDANGRFATATWDAHPQAPGPWTLGGTSTSAGIHVDAHIVAAARTANDLDVFAVTPHGEIVNFGWHAATGWDRDYAAVTAINFAEPGGHVAAVVENGELDVFAQRFFASETLVSNRWRNGWNKAAGTILPNGANANFTQLSAVSATPGTVDLFGTDTNGYLWTYHRNDATNTWTQSKLTYLQLIHIIRF